MTIPITGKLICGKYDKLVPGSHCGLFFFPNLSVLLVFLQSLMLAERACVYNMLLNLMETREAGKKQHIGATLSYKDGGSTGSLN